MTRKDPPKEHRFKPGQSGNPGGRPKGSVGLSARVRELLKQPTQDGKQLADVLAEVLIRETLKNPAKMWSFLREMIERDEGKVMERLEVSTAPLDLVGLVKQLEDEAKDQPKAIES